MVHLFRLLSPELAPVLLLWISPDDVIMLLCASKRLNLALSRHAVAVCAHWGLHPGRRARFVECAIGMSAPLKMIVEDSRIIRVAPPSWLSALKSAATLTATTDAISVDHFTRPARNAIQIEVACNRLTASAASSVNLQTAVECLVRYGPVQTFV